MKVHLKPIMPLMAAIALMVAAANEARAVLTVTFWQDGADVAVNVNGSLDLSGLTVGVQDTSYSAEQIYVGAYDYQWISSAVGTYDTFTLPSGTLNISGSFSIPDNTTYYTPDFVGDVGIWGTYSTDTVYVNGDYVSGVSVDLTTSILNTTLADIGMIVGESRTVSWTDGAGDSITFAAVSAVPEPSTYVLCAGLAVLGVAMHRRRRSLAKVING